MRMLIGLAVLAMVAAPASAALINGDYETGDTTGWARWGTGGNTITVNDTNHAPVPAQLPGSLYYGSSAGGGGGDRGMWQVVEFTCPPPCNPGDWCEVNLSGYFKARSNGGTIYASKLELGSMASVDIPVGGGTGGLDLYAVPTVILECGVTYEVTVAWYMDGDETWTTGRTIHGDNIVLSTECVPEPASLALLALGGLPFLRRRR